MKIELAPRAVQEAETCARWWRANRPDAPRLFEEELHSVLEAIKAAPQHGNLYSVQLGREHRRVLMPATRFHVYYRLAEPRLIRVVAIWSAVRGRGPRI